MKKKNIIILVIIIIVLIILGLITSYIDSARVRNAVEPKFTIKIISDDGNKVTYWGLGYKVIRYPSVSPKEPYKNNRGVKYGNWFMKYNIIEIEKKESSYVVSEIENLKINITDLSLKGITLTIKDTNENPYTYGEWYRLEKEEKGKWYGVKPLIKNYGFNSIAYMPDKNNNVKFDIDWEWLYGELLYGSYRILKEVGNKYIAVEFSVADALQQK